MSDEATLLSFASRTTGKIAKALATAQAAMRAAVKDSVNPHFKSSYADLAEVISASRDALAAQSIAVIQRPMHGDGGVVLQTVLLHESGEWIADGGLFLPVTKADAQGYGSALTYARRYGLASVVGVAQADDDGNAAAAQTKPATTTTKVVVISPDDLDEAFKERKFSPDQADAAIAGFCASRKVEKFSQLTAVQRLQLLQAVKSGKADKYKEAATAA